MTTTTRRDLIRGIFGLAGSLIGTPIFWERAASGFVTAAIVLSIALSIEGRELASLKLLIIACLFKLIEIPYTIRRTRPLDSEMGE